MAYRYINPGYGGLFESLSSSGYTQTTSSTYTKSGVGFACTNFSLNQVPSGTKELWCKFDYYKNSVSGSTILQVNAAAKNCRFVPSSSGVVNIYINGTSVKSFNAPDFNLKTWYVHIKSSGTAGIFEFYLDGELIYSYSGNVLDDEDIISYQIRSTYGGAYLSNIIVSDVAVGLTEKVIILPIATTTGTMTDNGDGTYSADAVDEYLDQTINTSALSLPSDTVITGIAIAGNPAYRDGEGISYMTAMQDNTPLADVLLGTTNKNGIFVGKTVHQTIAQMCASTYGWKAKA